MTAGRSSRGDKNKDWNTPQKYVDLILEFFDNEIDLDPCSNEYSILPASLQIMPPENGLSQNWNCDKIYVNPPYGRCSLSKTSIKDWFIKVRDTRDQYGGEILMLVPVATNTSHWKECVFNHASSICFLNDTRLKFLKDGKLCKKGCPMACCIIYYGDNLDKFHNVFKSSGNILNVTR